MRLADVAPQVRLDVTVGGVGGDHHELLVVELGDGEVGLEQPALVEPLRVGDLPGVAVDGVGGDVVEHTSGVAALDAELRHEAHVHHDHALAAGTVLGLPLVPRTPGVPT